MTPPDPTDISRVKGWRDLAPRGRAILKELLVVRDREAKRRDRPPFRIAGRTLKESSGKVPTITDIAEVS